MKNHTPLLSTEAGLLIRSAYEGLNPDDVIDYHVHLIGTQKNKGNFLHPDFASLSHPHCMFLWALLKKAFGIKSLSHVEEESCETLLRYANQAEGKYCILAFDANYENETKTCFVVSNEYIQELFAKHPDRFLPSASIHPYRPDAVSELEKRASQGVRLIKWLPSVMGINPADPRCVPFYKKMSEFKMCLLTHAGSETLLPIVSNQEFGNPLLLRGALEQGLRVIMAHAATLGSGADLDFRSRPRVKYFDLFLRMMKENQGNGLLFGDLSSVTLINRMRYLDLLLEESQPGGILEGRLVNGSDYPVPCCSFVISTRLLQWSGYITNAERKGLNEIFRMNPLLFDFVLKRTLRHPQTGCSFPKDIFVRKL